MPWLAFSDSFEYLCYGSTTIINMFTLTARGSILDRRQILTSKVDPRGVSVKDVASTTHDTGQIILHPLLDS